MSPADLLLLHLLSPALGHLLILGLFLWAAGRRSLPRLEAADPAGPLIHAAVGPVLAAGPSPHASGCRLVTNARTGDATTSRGGGATPKAPGVAVDQRQEDQ